MYAKVHEAGKVVMIHSCGDVKEIFPDLIEGGVDIFNPFQPEVMKVFKMKESYGEKITFYGEVSIQKNFALRNHRTSKKRGKNLVGKDWQERRVYSLPFSCYSLGCPNREHRRTHRRRSETEKEIKW